MRVNILGFLTALILVILSMSACASPALTEKEAYIIVDKLLNLEPYSGDAKDALARYRAWSNLYMDYWRRAKGDAPSEEDMKIYLLLVFAAYKSASAETTEHIAETFIPIFEKNSGAILKILGNRHFMVETTCQAIAEGFSYADSKELAAKAKIEFMGKYKHPIMEALKRNNMDKQCLTEIGRQN